MATIPNNHMHMAAQVRSAGDNNPWTVTMGAHAVGGSGWSLGPFNQAEADAINAVWSSGFVPLLDTSMEYLGTMLTWRDNIGDLYSTFVNDGTNGTSTSGPFLPQNVAVLIHKNTARAGVRFRGRMYIPSVAEQSVNSVGALDAAWQATYQAIADTWQADLEDAVSTGLDQLVLLHEPSTAPVPSPVPAPTPITTMFVDPIAATQRRRLR